MKNTKSINIFLFLSGIIAFSIGSALLFIPETFQGSNGILLNNDVNLISEFRAPGGFLFASGVLISFGIFVSKLKFTSIVLSTLIYFSYGIGRIIGMIIDGIPNESLVGATAIEIIFGLIGILILNKSQNSNIVELRKAA